MTVHLREYQEALLSSVFQSFADGHKATIAVMATGGGKTKSGVEIVRRKGVPTCVVAHRSELIAQLSEALAEAGMTHRIVASKSTVAMCVSRHVQKFGKSFYHPQSPIGVASIQTLVKRLDKLSQWISTLRLILVDECHHATASQYMTVFDALDNSCEILGLTATPDRCDRKSLARVQKGVFDNLVEGPTPRWLINEGFLSPYKLIAPPPSIEMGDEDVSPGTGDYKAEAVRRKSHESRIVGDVVNTWQKFAAGKQTIVFTVDVETSHEMAKAFNDVGVRAAAVSGATPTNIRNALMDKFANGQITVLTNCQLISEGLDVPNVTCAVLARPTMSLGLYRQMIGRAARPVYAKGADLSTREGRLSAIANGPKPHSIIIDHVSSYKVHGLMDSPKEWKLIRPDGIKKSKNRDDEIPLRSCANEGCYQPYPATLKACPHCGHKPEPASRNGPEFVDGDLEELSPEFLAKLRGEIARVEGGPVIPYVASPVVEASVRKRWRERTESREVLKNVIAIWAGVGKNMYGESDSEMYRRWYHTIGGKKDVLTCLTLGKNDLDMLVEVVKQDTEKRIEESKRLLD